MPKMKTRRALKKRVKKNAAGNLKRKHAYTGHLALGKTTKQKRHLKKRAYINKTDQKRLEGLLQD